MRVFSKFYKVIIMGEKKRVNFNLDEDIHIRVKHLALDKKTTATELFTKWILKGLEKEEKEQKKLHDY